MNYIGTTQRCDATGDDIVGEDLLLLSSPHETQRALRLAFIQQEWSVSGVRVEFSAEDEVSFIPGRGAAFLKENLGDDDIPEQLVPVRPKHKPKLFSSLFAVEVTTPATATTYAAKAAANEAGAAPAKLSVATT